MSNYFIVSLGTASTEMKERVITLIILDTGTSPTVPALRHLKLRRSFRRS